MELLRRHEFDAEREPPAREHAPQHKSLIRPPGAFAAAAVAAMAETDTDPADEFDASLSRGALDERAPGLFRRYRRLPRNVLVISLVSFLNDASSEIIYPLLPVFLSVTLGASPAVIGLIEGGAESVSSFLKLFAGYFSDRSGRRKAPVVFGYALAGLARPLLGFATSWPQVFAVRFADRVGKGIRSAPRDAMIADSAAPHERGLAFGFHRAMDHFGAVIGPLLGFALVAFIAADSDAIMPGEYRLIFLAASVPALAAVLVAAFAIRESRQDRDDGRAARKAESERADALRAGSDAAAAPVAAAPAVTAIPRPPRFSLRGFDGNFKRFLLIIALFTLSNSSDTFLLLRAREVGIASSNLPLLWAALHGIKVLSSLVGGDLSDRLGRKTLIVTGWLFYAAVYLGFAFVSTAAGAWTLFLIYGIYFGLAEGAEKALVADLVPA
ncbi:MAG TPA: MFS transporter, partial [Pyrinomonadaceae bacterium]|nr:MFS transporter [Pyrinomonadaceae bacterium]